MISSKVRDFIIIFALILATGIASTGCASKSAHQGWVNTKSLPGNTFADHSRQAGSQAIVYMGDNKSDPNSKFGPSFDFNDLKK